MSGITGTGSDITPVIGPQGISGSEELQEAPKGTSSDTLSPAEQQEELNDLPLAALMAWMPILQQPLFNDSSNDPGKIGAMKFNAKVMEAERTHELIIGILDAWINNIADEAKSDQKNSADRARIMSMTMDSILYLASIETMLKAEDTKNSAQAQVLMATLMASYALSVASIVSYAVTNERFKGAIELNASKSVEEAHGDWSQETKEKYKQAVVAMSTLTIAYTAMSIVARAEADRAEAVNEDPRKDSNEIAKEDAKKAEDPTQAIQTIIANSKALLKACGMTDDELARIEDKIDDDIDASMKDGGEFASINSIFAYMLMVLESGRPQGVSSSPTAA